MADDFTREMVRVVLLSAGSQPDAAMAVAGGAVDLVDGISDDEAREMFGFWNGVAATLCHFGHSDGPPLLKAVEVLSPTPDDMRAAIKAALRFVTETAND